MDDSVFCKGRKLIRVSIRKIENLGLTPCKCMEDADKVLEKKIAVALEQDQESDNRSPVADQREV